MRRPFALRGGAIALAAALVSGCTSWSTTGDAVFGVLTPYRIDIQQGNVVTQEQLARVKPGMNRLQVRDVMGTPLLTDAFHTDRWDYIFTLRQSGRPLQRRNVVLQEMVKLGVITQAQFVQARDKPLGVIRRAPTGTSPYPAFLQYVHRQLQRDYREEDLRSEGLRIFTTLDPRVQREAEQALLRFAHSRAVRHDQFVGRLRSVQGLDRPVITAQPRHWICEGFAI